MKYKAIFIDIDDTLLDYIPCCRGAFDAAMIATIGAEQWALSPQDELFDLFFAISGRLFSEAKHGLHTVAEVMDLYPAEFIETSHLAADRGIDPELMTDTFKHAFRLEWGNSHTLVSDALATLQALKFKGYKLYAASNSFGHLQRRRLEKAGILHLFDDTFISMDIGYDKPDRRFFLHALASADLTPNEVLMVGDSMTTDILGAQQVGLDTCWYNPLDEQRNEAAPTYRIKRLAEMLEFL